MYTYSAILPALNYAQPMNPLHRLNDGYLRLWLKALPNLSGANTVTDLVSNRWPATLSNHTWGSGGPFGPITTIPVYAGASGSIGVTNFTQHGTLRSYTWWAYRTGIGGSGAGVGYSYFLSKRESTHQEIEYCDYENPGVGSGPTVNFYRRWSTTAGNWYFTAPSANVWHFYGVSYDSGSTANVPAIYVDGVAQSITANTSPAGTLVTNTDKYSIGATSDGLTSLDGKVDDFRIYDRILSAGEHAHLYQESKGPFSPLYNWQSQLVIFATKKKFIEWRRILRPL